MVRHLDRACIFASGVCSCLIIIMFDKRWSTVNNKILFVSIETYVREIEVSHLYQSKMALYLTHYDQRYKPCYCKIGSEISFRIRKKIRGFGFGVTEGDLLR